MPKGLGKGYSELTEEDKDRIVQLFDEHVTVNNIAKRMPCTQRAVPQVLKERNIITRRKNRYTLNEHYFDTIETEHQAYWLGLIMADGCITTTNYFALALSAPDQYLIYDLAHDLEYTGTVYVPKTRDNRNLSSRLNFSSKILCDALRNLNINEHKINRTDLPSISDKLISHFLRGVFDGDGCIMEGQSTTYHKGKKYIYTRYSMTIACPCAIGQKLQVLINDVIHYTPTLYKHNSKNCWYVGIHKQSALQDFYHYLYDNATIFITRKKDKWDTFMSAYGK